MDLLIGVSQLIGTLFCNFFPLGAKMTLKTQIFQQKKIRHFLQHFFEKYSWGLFKKKLAKILRFGQKMADFTRFWQNSQTTEHMGRLHP